MVALDTETGEELWRFHPADSEWEYSSGPVVAGDTVYFGAADGNLYALEEN